MELPPAGRAAAAARLLPILLLSLLLAGGCDGEGQEAGTGPSAADVVAARAEGPAAFRQFCEQVRGRTVHWTGTVLQATQEAGAPPAQPGMLLLDTDGDAGHQPEVVTAIPLAQVSDLPPGQTVMVRGIIRGCEKYGIAEVVRLELRGIEWRTQAQG